jgi:hypothetical protein
MRTGCIASDIALSARPKALDRLVRSRSFPLSGVSAANPVSGAVQLVNPPRNAPSRVLYDSVASNQPRAIQLRRMRYVLR